MAKSKTGKLTKEDREVAQKLKATADSSKNQKRLMKRNADHQSVDIAPPPAIEPAIVTQDPDKWQNVAWRRNRMLCRQALEPLTRLCETRWQSAKSEQLPRPPRPCSAGRWTFSAVRNFMRRNEKGVFVKSTSSGTNAAETETTPPEATLARSELAIAGPDVLAEYSAQASQIGDAFCQG